MFKFHINKKNLKQSSTNLSLFLKEKGFNIPKNVIMEAIAKVFFVKNWNTIESMAKNNIEPIIEENKKILCLKIDLSDNETISMLKKSISDTEGCCFYIDDFRKDSNNNTLYFYFCSNNEWKHWVDFVSLFTDRIKQKQINVDKFEYFNISTQKCDWAFLF